MSGERGAWDLEQAWLPPGHRYRLLPFLGLALGVTGLATAWLAGDPTRFYFAYHVAFLFWLSIAIGALFFVLLQHATKAAWSVVVRRLAETWMSALFVLAVLFVPVILGMHSLFHWSHAEVVAADAVLTAKAPYLNPPFFIVRAVVYFACWCFCAWLFWRRSLAQDQNGDAAISRQLNLASYPALIVFALTITFAAFDWIMSLEPHWYSTVFGVYLFAGSVVSVHAVLAIMAVVLRRTGLAGGAVTAEHLHDLGKFMFAFTVFWAYIAFSQYMLIWYANLPEETFWFAERWQGSWRYATIALVLGHFAVPLFFLLPRTIKRHGFTLTLGAVWMLAMQLLDIYWLVMPVLQRDGVAPNLTDVAAFVGVGGLCVAWVSFQLGRHALVPVRDPRLDESLAFENM